MNIFVYYTAAAIAEIAGCFAFWSWLRLGKTVYWILPGTIALLIFPILLPVLRQYLQAGLLRPMAVFI